MNKSVVPFKDVVKWILITGLVTGTLDAAGAVLVRFADPVKMFQFISSGAIDRETAMAGGWMTATVGVVFHYFIATSWCALYYFLWPRLSFLREQRLLSGILYGIVIWLVMNLIVLKLSLIKTQPIQLKGMLIGTSILIIAIGIPLAYIASWRMKKNFEITSAVNS